MFSPRKILFLTFVAGCGGGDPGTSSTPPAENTEPQILSLESFKGLGPYERIELDARTNITPIQILDADRLDFSRVDLLPPNYSLMPFDSWLQTLEDEAFHPRNLRNQSVRRFLVSRSVLTPSPERLASGCEMSCKLGLDGLFACFDSCWNEQENDAPPQDYFPGYPPEDGEPVPNTPSSATNTHHDTPGPDPNEPTADERTNGGNSGGSDDREGGHGNPYTGRPGGNNRPPPGRD